MPKKKQPKVFSYLHWNSAVKYIAITFFTASTLAYLILTLFPAPDKAVLRQYHLTIASYRGILFPAVIILVISWVVSLYGAVKIKAYADVIKKSNEGRALNIISAGFLVLTVSQPVYAALAGVFGQIDRHSPHLLPAFTIVSNYVSLFLVALAMIIISVGGSKLRELGDGPKDKIPAHVWMTAFIILSSLYSYFIVIQPIHAPVTRRAYFLPDWLLITTIAIPYLYVWYRGIYAAYQIYEYQSNIRGLIYKSALKYLAGGVAVVILSSIATRILTTVSTRLTQLSLTPILFILYALIVIDAAGFVLIAIGANKLKQIEEV
jgi:hypothetical protein